MLVIDRYFVAARNFLLEWIALNGEDAGQSQTHSAAMTHGMARIRLGRLERVVVTLTSMQKKESVKGWKSQMKKRVKK